MAKSIPTQRDIRQRLVGAELMRDETLTALYEYLEESKKRFRPGRTDAVHACVERIKQLTPEMVVK